MDFLVIVVKFDIILMDDFVQVLKDVVCFFENILEEEKDWDLEFDNQIFNFVDLFFWFLFYGKI